jgi:hypothetical protein
MRQAAEHLAAAGGLPVAVRYLRRAAELPPSNTSWYMGLSNGSAGLCAPRALLAFCPVQWAPAAAFLDRHALVLAHSWRIFLSSPLQPPGTRPGTWSCPTALHTSVCPQALCVC